MDWFERLTGFRENGYNDTRRKLTVEDGQLQSLVNGKSSATGTNARRGASNVVLLTQVGGGAFGNHDDWIHAAMRQALHQAAGYDLDVKLLSYGLPSPATLEMSAGRLHAGARPY